MGGYFYKYIDEHVIILLLDAPQKKVFMEPTIELRFVKRDGTLYIEPGREANIVNSEFIGKLKKRESREVKIEGLKLFFYANKIVW